MKSNTNFIRNSLNGRAGRWRCKEKSCARDVTVESDNRHCPRKMNIGITGIVEMGIEMIITNRSLVSALLMTELILTESCQ